jgi:thiol-disulfide isomerase/thioredoxin
MKRRQVITASVATAAAAAAAGAGWAWWRTSLSPASPGADEKLWTMTFERPAGGELAMHTLRGRPLLLNFWATWCPPCVAEMPMLDAFQRDQPADGWRVLGLAVDQLKPVSEFLIKRPMKFEIGLAGLQGLDLSRELGNTAGALPFSAAFNRRGQLVKTHLGPLTAPDLSAWKSMNT